MANLVILTWLISALVFLTWKADFGNLLLLLPRLMVNLGILTWLISAIVFLTRGLILAICPWPWLG